MTLNINQKQWVDYYFGNRDGALEKCEWNRFEQMQADTQLLGQIFERAKEWENYQTVNDKFVSSGLTGTIEIAHAIYEANISESDFTPTVVQSAMVLSLSEGSMIRSMTLYGKPGMENVFYSDKILNAMGGTGHEKIALQNYPADFSKPTLAVWGQMIKAVDGLTLDRPIDTNNPWLHLSLPTADGLFDLVYPSHSATEPYESDYDTSRCWPQGEELCASTKYTQDLIDQGLPAGTTVMDLMKDRDVVVFPFPTGNNMKVAIFSVEHRFEVQMTIEQMEAFLKVSEKMEKPPRFVTATLGTVRPYIRQEVLNNNKECYTFSIRGYYQELAFQKAMELREKAFGFMRVPNVISRELESPRQSWDPCPITEDNIRQIDSDMDEYNRQLIALQAKYPNLFVIDIDPFFKDIQTNDFYTSPKDQKRHSFHMMQTIDADGLHFSYAFQPVLANQLIAGLNNILGTQFEFTDENVGPVPSYLDSKVPKHQLPWLYSIELNRREEYKFSYRSPVVRE